MIDPSSYNMEDDGSVVYEPWLQDTYDFELAGLTNEKIEELFLPLHFSILEDDNQPSKPDDDDDGDDEGGGQIRHIN